VTVTPDQVLRDAGAGSTDSDLASEVLDEATAYVDAYISTTLVDITVPVPDAIYDASVLVCATDLFARRKAPFGQQIMPDPSGVAVVTRLGADPLGGVRAKLRPWCFNIGFAYPVDDGSDDCDDDD
jgi:hypothetical protein